MGYFSQLLLIAVSTAIVNNVVLSQFLGLCPFLGVSKKINTAAGMGGAVIGVITISSAVCSLIYDCILTPLKLTYLNTIVFRYVSLSGVSIQSYIRLQTADEIVITPITAPPIPAAVFIFLETPRKGHKPRNWLKTTLLTIAVLTAINNNCEKYPIFTSLSYS